MVVDLEKEPSTGTLPAWLTRALELKHLDFHANSIANKLVAEGLAAFSINGQQVRAALNRWEDTSSPITPDKPPPAQSSPADQPISPETMTSPAPAAASTVQAAPEDQSPATSPVDDSAPHPVVTAMQQLGITVINVADTQRVFDHLASKGVDYVSRSDVASALTRLRLGVQPMPLRGG
jgi:hypothetical protein